MIYFILYKKNEKIWCLKMSPNLYFPFLKFVIKAFLNGNNQKGILTKSALVCKVLGVCFSVAGGLICGKEGPLVHTGSVVAV